MRFLPSALKSSDRKAGEGLQSFSPTLSHAPDTVCSILSETFPFVQNELPLFFLPHL